MTFVSVKAQVHLFCIFTCDSFAVHFSFSLLYLKSKCRQRSKYVYEIQMSIVLAAKKNLLFSSASFFFCRHNTGFWPFTLYGQKFTLNG